MWGEEAEICNVNFVGFQEQNRSIAVVKGDALQVVPKHWEGDELDYIWVDSETGEPITVGMVVDRDIVATLVKQ